MYNALGSFGAPPIPRRNVFISSFHADRREVDDFLYRWSQTEKVFIPKALCTFDNDDFINSTNSDYVMREIRLKYIGDASVTIVLIGSCTHSRRYVDWEIKASLTQGQSLPNGLLAYVLPSAMPAITDWAGNQFEWGKRAWPHLPERLSANWNYNHQQTCYARYFVTPDSSEALRQNIESAFADRTRRANLIVNSSEMLEYNGQCKLCGVTH
jgi:hypothetical protein